VLQIINFYSHKSSPKNKNGKHNYNLGQQIFTRACLIKQWGQNHIFILDQVSFFSLRLPKCGRFTYIFWKYVILQLKKQQREVLE